MGKIRVKTIGIEEEEKKQEADAKKRSEAKKAESKDIEPSAEATPTEETETKKKVKKEKFQKNKQIRSKAYSTKVENIDKKKIYKLDEAVEILLKIGSSKFDETIELHLNLTQTGISGSTSLPHGTGKKTRVAIASSSDAEALDELIKKIESSNIDFDILIATPDAMPKLAKVARVLGPRGLMPNPKNGTVTPNPELVAKKFKGGQVNFKSEAKSPILHLAIGKISFGDKKLKENIKAIIAAVDSKNINNTTIKSTMSPGLKVDVSSLK